MQQMTDSRALEAPARRKKSGRLVTALVTAALLVFVAVAVTHPFAQRPAPPVQIVVHGALFNEPSPPAPVPVAPRAESPKPGSEYAQVGFDRLAGFPIATKWVMTDPIRIKGVQTMVGDLPATIKALDRDKIAVQGFMLPFKMTDGLVSDFFLLRTQAKCCFGLPIQMNELLTVHMTGAGVQSLMDQPITVFGTLHVGQFNDAASGALTTVYRLDGDGLKLPAKL